MPRPAVTPVILAMLEERVHLVILTITLMELTVLSAHLSIPIVLLVLIAHIVLHVQKALQERFVLTALWDTLETAQSVRLDTEVLAAPLAPQTITPLLPPAPPAQPSTVTASPAADQLLASLAPQDSPRQVAQHVRLALLETAQLVTLATPELTAPPA